MSRLARPLPGPGFPQKLTPNGRPRLVMIPRAWRILRPAVFQPLVRQPPSASTGYGRSVFGGNGTRVGLVPMPGRSPSRRDRDLRCHMQAGPKKPACFFSSPAAVSRPVESRLEIGDEVLHVLDTDGQADQRLRDSRTGACLGVQRGMRHARRMSHEALHAAQ